MNTFPFLLTAVFVIVAAVLINEFFWKPLNVDVSSTSPDRSDSELKNGIASLYDEGTGVWLETWGDNLHHGFYHKTNENNKDAQVEMIEQAVSFGYGGEKIDLSNKAMIDVGCGVGGSSRHIVKNYGGSGEGISLSSYQVKAATELTAKANLSDVLHFQVADAMKMPFPDNSFDLAWSMESGEHMPDKKAFVQELTRVTKPDGRIIIVTWCHRELLPDEQTLAPWELKLLNKISTVFYLPEWVPASRYVSLAESFDLQDIRMADWTEYITPFWTEVITSALNPVTFFKLIMAGRSTLQSAYTAFAMREGVNKGLIRFVIITAQKKV